MRPKFKSQSQINMWDLDINMYLVFCRNNVWLMVNMDKGLTVPKWVLINRSKIPQMPQNVSAQALKVGISKKKALLGVHSPWLPSLVYCGKVLTFSLSVCLHFAIGDCKYFLEFFFAFHTFYVCFFNFLDAEEFTSTVTETFWCDYLKDI